MSTCCNCAGTPPPTSVGSCCYLKGEDIECTDVLLDDPTLRMTGPEGHILPQGEFHLGVECHQFSCVTTTTTAAPAAYCFEQVSVDLEYCFRQNNTITVVSEEVTVTDEWIIKGQIIQGESNTRNEDTDPPPPPTPDFPTQPPSTDPEPTPETTPETPPLPPTPPACHDRITQYSQSAQKYVSVDKAARCEWIFDDFLFHKNARDSSKYIDCEYDGYFKNWTTPGHCLCPAPVDRNGIDIGPRGDRFAGLLHVLYEDQYNTYKHVVTADCPFDHGKSSNYFRIGSIRPGCIGCGSDIDLGGQWVTWSTVLLAGGVRLNVDENGEPFQAPAVINSRGEVEIGEESYYTMERSWGDEQSDSSNVAFRELMRVLQCGDGGTARAGTSWGQPFFYREYWDFESANTTTLCYAR